MCVAAPAARAATYEAGYGAVPFYSFEDEPLNDRMGLRVNLASGNLLVSTSDLGISGTGLDMIFERSYNSLSGSTEVLSPGWRLNFGNDVKVTPLADGNVEFQAPTYFRAVFVKQPDGSFKTPMGLQAALGKDPDGAWTVTYNQSRTKLRFSAAGNSLSSITDKNGNDIDPTSDTSGRTYQILDTQDRTTTLAYDTAGRLSTVTDPTGRRATYGYDAAGNLTSYVDLAGKTTRYAYNASRKLTEIVDPRGNKTKIAYDSGHRVTSFTRVTDSATGTGPTTGFAYATGDTRCPAGTTSTRVTDPNANATIYCVDDERRVRRVIDALGHVRNSDFDTDANVTQLADGSSISKATWLEGGRIDTITAPTGGKTSFAYGDSTHRFFPTGSTNPQGRTTSFSWQNNNLTRVTDGDQKQTNLTYNANGTLATSTSPKGAGLADPNPYKTMYAYDPKGNLTKVTYPAPLGAETYTYDALSRLATRTDGKGQKQTYFYDALDRVCRIEYRTAAGVLESAVTYAYDANGNRTSRGGSTGTTTYVYDALNRLKSESLPLPAVSQTYGYDAAGNLTAFSDAGGTVAYAYDKVNNLTRLTEPGGAVTTFGYDARDNRSTTAFPNGVTITRQFDLSDRVTDIVARKGTNAPIVSRAYSYDPDGTGPLTDSDLRFKDTDRAAGTTTSYAYDLLDRLRDAHTQTTATGATRERFTYTYDANSNRTSQVRNGTTTTYVYNAANQLCWRVTGSSSAGCASPPAGAVTYGYDANGNETSNSEGRALGYNARSQMVSSRVPGQSFTETFTFAGADQWERARAAGHPDDDFSYTNSPLGLMSLVGDKGYVARYVRDDDGGLVAINSGGYRRYFIADALGSIVALTDANGVVDGTYTYEPFGETLTSTGSRQPWGFAGQYRDTNNFYKLGMRWYDAKIGRWSQQDPIELADDTRQANRYLYAGADPVNLSDPTGELVPAIVAIGAFGARVAAQYAVRQGVRYATRAAVRSSSSRFGQMRAQYSYQYGDKSPAIGETAKRIVESIF
jgi:RHS repeat-associated protein